MDIVFLIIGLIVGAGIGYLIAGRKSAALSAQLQATREREELLNRTVEERKSHNNRTAGRAGKIFQSEIGRTTETMGRAPEIASRRSGSLTQTYEHRVRKSLQSDFQE